LFRSPSADSDPVSSGTTGSGGVQRAQQRVLGQRAPRFGTSAFFRGLKDALCGCGATKKKKSKKDKKKVRATNANETLLRCCMLSFSANTLAPRIRLASIA
jgi:hypothetical protein